MTPDLQDLRHGIEKTLNATKEQPMTLEALTKDKTGQVQITTDATTITGSVRDGHITPIEAYVGPDDIKDLVNEHLRTLGVKKNYRITITFDTDTDASGKALFKGARCFIKDEHPNAPH